MGGMGAAIKGAGRLKFLSSLSPFLPAPDSMREPDRQRELDGERVKEGRALMMKEAPLNCRRQQKRLKS